MATAGERDEAGDLFRHAPKQARAQRSIDQVLSAAAKILASDPSALSMSEIARNSSVSKGTAYRYFPELENVVVALAVPYVRQAVARVDEALADLPGPVEAVIAVNQLMNDAVETCRNDSVARAIFVTHFNRAFIGDLLNDAVDEIARRATDHLAPILNDREGQHLRRIAIGTHTLRSVIDMGINADEEEADRLIVEFSTMMFLAAEVNLHRPVPLEVDPVAAGLVESAQTDA